jgi:hypothetical protein
MQDRNGTGLPPDILLDGELHHPFCHGYLRLDRLDRLDGVYGRRVLWRL